MGCWRVTQTPDVCIQTIGSWKWRYQSVTAITATRNFAHMFVCSCHHPFRVNQFDPHPVHDTNLWFEKFHIPAMLVKPTCLFFGGAPQIVRWHINPCSLLTRRLIPSLYLVTGQLHQKFGQLYPTYSRYQFAKCLEYSNIQSLVEYTELSKSELACRCQKFGDDLMIMSTQFSWLNGFLLDKWVC